MGMLRREICTMPRLILRSIRRAYSSGYIIDPLEPRALFSAATFQSGAYSAGAQTFFLTAADFNADARSDVAVILANNAIAVLLNNGSGALGAPSVYPVGSIPIAITT